MPARPYLLSGPFSRRGFTLVGGLTSLALLSAAVAVCVPLVIQRLRAHAPAADSAARRIEAAVTRSLDSVGKIADEAGGDLAWPPPSAAVAASLPDGPVRYPLDFPAAWDGPVNAPLLPLPWGPRPVFWKPFFTRPAPWYFFRRPPWRAGGWRRK